VPAIFAEPQNNTCVQPCCDWKTSPQTADDHPSACSGRSPPLFATDAIMLVTYG
jgi:hypothetical protein